VWIIAVTLLLSLPPIFLLATLVAWTDCWQTPNDHKLSHADEDDSRKDGGVR
jgi:hypothetical protein